jgi:hypothetical protein
MLVAIERSKFNYLFKFNSIPADLNSIYWHGKENLLKIQRNNIDRAVVELDEILPMFEEDHEAILLEYDRMTWEQDDRRLEFSGILSIIPLTNIGKRLLTSKLNDSIKLGDPLFEETIKFVKIKRELRLKRIAAKKLLSLFHLDDPPREAILLIDKAIARISNDLQSTGDNENIFFSLFNYNTTEGFIPEGNVEYLCKTAVLARIHLGQDPSLVQQGPFYKELLRLVQTLNRKGIVDAYLEFKQLSTESITSTQKVREAITGDLNFDMLFVAYIFFAFRRILNKSENDLNSISREIQNLRRTDHVVASIAVYAIGTVFSFDQLYESLHRLSGAPLLGGIRWQPDDYGKVIPKENQGKMDVSKSSDLDDVPLVQEDPPSVRASDNTKENVNPPIKPFEADNPKTSYTGIPVRLFVEFLDKELAEKKAKDIQKFIKAFSSELRNGITLKWIEEKLLTVNSSKKSGKLTAKDIASIKAFFENNKVLN